ncbi:MAG: divalent-cation tolerance protein CutA [Candidatus Micrarchaeia archaeon]
MMSIIYSPFPNKESASRTVEALLNKKLIACANIVRSDSIYFWEGKMERSREYILIAKTIPTRKQSAIKIIGEMHPYKIPAILAWNVNSNRGYEKWAKAFVCSTSRRC